MPPCAVVCKVVPVRDVVVAIIVCGMFCQTAKMFDFLPYEKSDQDNEIILDTTVLG
jgi:hypothetical protein